MNFSELYGQVIVHYDLPKTLKMEKQDAFNLKARPTGIRVNSRPYTLAGPGDLRTPAPEV